MDLIQERVVERFLAASGRPKVDPTPRGPGINPDGTITLLHGTTALAAQQIRDHGFRPTDPKEVAELLAHEYGLQTSQVLNHAAFGFARRRADRDRIHFTSIPGTAQHYSVPEIVQDGLDAVWSIQNPHETMTRQLHNERRDWVRSEGERLQKPEILAVTMPWEAVGNHAFGKKLTLQEWQGFGELRDLHAISIPISALGRIRIQPFG